MKVYAVVCDYAVDFENGVTYSLYKSKDKAIEAFYEKIEKEKDFWGINELDEDTFTRTYTIEFDEVNHYWVIYEIGSYAYAHSVVSLEEKEIIK